MKKELMQGLKIIILGLILSVGASFIFADWVSPPPNPPSDNVSGPINAGLVNQEKSGGLSILGGFTGWSNSAFMQKLFVGGTPPNQSNASKLFVIGDMTATSDITSVALAGETKVPGNTVCADGGGKLVLCQAGACGSSNGQALSSKPTTNLCTKGTPTGVTGTGAISTPWIWYCYSGGGLASCSASQGGCHGTYTITEPAYCEGANVVGSYTPSQTPGPWENTPCEDLPASVCQAGGWAIHGCHWVPAASYQESCSSFTTQPSCTTHSGCSWN